MPKFTRVDREKIRRLVQLCIIRHFSTSESLDYIEDRVRIRISARTFRSIKADLKEEVENDVASLMQDRFLLEAHQRIEEIRENYRCLMDLKDQAQQIETIEVRVKVYREIEKDLASLTMKLASLMDSLPFVISVQKRMAEENQEK